LRREGRGRLEREMFKVELVFVGESWLILDPILSQRPQLQKGKTRGKGLTKNGSAQIQSVTNLARKKTSLRKHLLSSTGTAEHQ